METIDVRPINYKTDDIGLKKDLLLLTGSFRLWSQLPRPAVSKLEMQEGCLEFKGRIKPTPIHLGNFRQGNSLSFGKVYGFVPDKISSD